MAATTTATTTHRIVRLAGVVAAGRTEARSAVGVPQR
jgi:hypothetical protein